MLHRETFKWHRFSGFGWSGLRGRCSKLRQISSLFLQFNQTNAYPAVLWLATI